MKEILEGWRAHYKRLAMQNMLAENLVEKYVLPEQKPGGGNSEEYAKRASDHEMMKSVFLDLREGESNETALQMIQNDEWEEPNPQRFFESLNSSKRQGYLTAYSLEDLAKMKLFKLKDLNIGFALKDGDDIVSVHNNEGVGGLGKALVAAAVKHGGRKLDHFDGFLTGLYEKSGFGKIVGTDAWNDMYAPDEWEYEPVNIFDPRTSIHAKELRKYDTIEEVPDELKAKIRAYEEGKPDIVYRVMG